MAAHRISLLDGLRTRCAIALCSERTPSTIPARAIYSTACWSRLEWSGGVHRAAECQRRVFGAPTMGAT